MNLLSIKRFESLLLGNYHPLSQKTIASLSNSFKNWEDEMQRIRKRSNIISRLRLFLLRKRNKINVFSPEFRSLDTEDSKKIFLENVFTDFFPPYHDFSDWAVTTKITDIFVLLDLRKEDVNKMVICIKHHFVNHGKKEGIICFDIYQ